MAFDQIYDHEKAIENFNGKTHMKKGYTPFVKKVAISTNRLIRKKFDNITITNKFIEPTGVVLNNMKPEDF